MHNGEASQRQSDTSEAARRRQIELFRAMSQAERLALAFSMSESTRELSLTGLQKLHPGESDLDLRVRLAHHLHGPAVSQRLKAALERRKR